MIGFTQFLSESGTVIPSALNDLESRLVRTARTVKHSGDYGKLFWNERMKKVLWVAADGDGFDPSDAVPLTPTDEIKRLFSVLPGVEQVEVCDECGVKEGEGWKRINY